MGPLWHFGVIGRNGALDFDGDDWLAVKDHDDLDLSDGSFTVEGWIQPRQSVYFQWMFDKSNSNSTTINQHRA